MLQSDYTKKLFATFCLTNLLAGCGAGTDPTGTAGNTPATPSFLNFTGNANGTFVTTGNGTVQFLTNYHLYSQNQEYNNVVLNTSDSTISVNGTVFGRLTLVPSSTGSQVAVFVCSNNNYATVSGTTLGCGSTSPLSNPGGSTATAPGGNTSNGSTTGGSTGTTPSGSTRPTTPPLSLCVSPVQNPQVYNWMDIRSSCGQPILLVWGFADMSSGTGAWHIPTGGHYQTGDTYKDYQAHGGYKYFICPEGYTPVNPTTHSYVSIRDTSYTCIKD
jgi:hypothetical protein